MNSQELFDKATELKEQSASQLQIVQDLLDAGKANGITVHFTGYTIGAKSFDGFDFRKILNLEALSSQFKKESEQLHKKFIEAEKEYQAALKFEQEFANKQEEELRSAQEKEKQEQRAFELEKIRVAAEAKAAAEQKFKESTQPQ